MKPIYWTMLYGNKQLIVKAVKDKQPFVIAEVYSAETANLICLLLNEQTEKENQ